MNVMIADYRWQGHRLLHILNLYRSLDSMSYSVFIHLPESAYTSVYWTTQMNAINDRQQKLSIDVDRKLSSTQTTPSNFKKWVKDVIDSANDNDVSLLLFPWADKMMVHIAELQEQKYKLPHIHLLFGRSPRGFFDIDNDERARTGESEELMKRITFDGSVCIGRLCSTLDSHAGKKIGWLSQAGNNKWIVDPITLVDPPKKQGARAALNLHSNRKYALLIGDLSRRKKALSVIRSWKRIYKEVGITLILVGGVDHSVKKLPQQTAALKRFDNESVLFDFSYVSQGDFINYIAAADVVLCTFSKTLGGYMSSGVSGLAATLGTPCFVDGNVYIERLTTQNHKGVVGKIDRQGSGEDILKAANMQLERINSNNINHEAFFAQWVKPCLNHGGDII